MKSTRRIFLQVAATGLAGGVTTAGLSGQELAERSAGRRLRFVQIDVFAEEA